MTIERVTSDYILNDGEVISMNIEFGEKGSATIVLKARKKDSKRTRDVMIEIRLTNLTVVDIVEDFTSRTYSDIKLTTLENGDYYLSLDPYDNSNVPNEEDNFVLRSRELDIVEQ